VHSRWRTATGASAESGVPHGPKPESDKEKNTVLTLTDNATSEIRNIIADPQVPDGCGLRIANDPAAGGLTLTLAAEPAQDDQVLDEGGARVFLEPQAAMMLDDKALDAGHDGHGQLRFTLASTDEA
jgi:Fe-S cluster assembly iron-binding protein IscA